METTEIGNKQSEVVGRYGNGSNVQTEEEDNNDAEEVDLSPSSSEKQVKKQSKWRKLTTSQKDKHTKKDKGREKLRSTGKENIIEMVDMDDKEKAKDGRKLSKIAKSHNNNNNNKERGLFKRPSLKDYRKKWKGGGGRRQTQSPVSPQIIKGEKSDVRTAEERRYKTNTTINDSPQITEQNKAFVEIVDGTDKMMWARRAFFMSTEKIFPGFIRNYGLRSNRSRDPTGVKLRTSIPLKMCLLAHSYFVPIWFIAFLFLQEFAATSLKPLHNYVHSCLTYICMVTDALRLYAGFISNARDDMQLLALYWMATVILQTPMMCFIFATHSFSVHILILMSTMDITLAIIILLEIWFGFWQLKGLVSSEMNLLHMARQMNEMQMMNDGRNRQPRVINSTEKGPYLDWSGSDNYDDHNEDDDEDRNGAEIPNKSILIAKQSGDTRLDNE